MLINKQKLKLLILALIQTNIVSAASVSTPITVASGTTTTINAADTASHAATTPAATVNSGTLTVDGTIENNGGIAAEIDRGSTLTINGTIGTNSNDNVIETTNNGTGNTNIVITGTVNRNSGNGGNNAIDTSATTHIIGSALRIIVAGGTINGGISTGPARLDLGTYGSVSSTETGGIVNGDIDMDINPPYQDQLTINRSFTTNGNISHIRHFHVNTANGATDNTIFNVRNTINNCTAIVLGRNTTMYVNGNANIINTGIQFHLGHSQGAKYIQNGSISGIITTPGFGAPSYGPGSGTTIEINNGETLRVGETIMVEHRGTLTLNNGSIDYFNAGGHPNFTATAVINLNSGTLTAPTITTNNSTKVNITANSSIVAATGYTANGVILKYTPSSATTLPLLTLNSGAAVDFSNATLKADLSATSLNAGTYTLATNTNASGLNANSANATVDFSRRFTSTLSVSAGNLIVNLVKKKIANIITHRHAREMLPRMSTLATSNSQMAEIENAMLDLSSEDIEYAAKQLTPEVNGASTSSAVLAGQSVSRVALDRLAALRDTNIATTGYVTGDINNDLAIWYKVFGGKIHQNKRKNVAGYDASLGGLAIGIDQAFTNSTTAGLGCSIANTNIKSRLVNAPNATNIVSYQGIAYGSFDNNNLFVDGAVNYANNRYVGNRIFKFGTIDRKALFKHHGHQFGIVLESGSKFYNNGGLNLKPIIYLSYIHSSKNPYTENVAESSDIGLKFDRSKTTRIDGGIGFKISKNFKTIDRRWTPNLHLSWTPNFHLRIIHDFKRARQASVSRFVGGGAAFATTGPRPARNVLNVGVGVKILSGDNFEFSAKYELEGKEHYLSYNGSFSARYMF